MKPSLPFVIAASLSLPAFAQQCPRPLSPWSQLGAGLTPSESRLSTPKETLPPPGAYPGVATGQLVHLGYRVQDQSDNTVSIRYQRSLDGGCSFQDEQTVWQGRSGESITYYRVVSTGHSVFVLVLTARDSSGQSTGRREFLWVVGSPRQGRPGTFQTALVSTGQEVAHPDGTLLDDVRTFDVDAAGGRAHCMFSANFLNAPPPFSGVISQPIPYYRAVEFQSGVLTVVGAIETRLDESLSSLESAIDPRVVAEGQRVSVLWRQSVVGLAFDTFSRSSIDGGATFLGSEQHTDFRFSQGLSNRETTSDIAIDGQDVYVSMVDERNAVGSGVGQVFLAVSRADGRPGSFTTQRVDPGLGSSSWAFVAASRGVAHVLYPNDRSGSTDLYAISGTAATLLAGAASEVRLATNLGRIFSFAVSNFPGPSSRDGRCAFAFVAGGQTQLGLTSNGGTSWEVCLSSASGDVLPSVVIGSRGDVVTAGQPGGQVSTTGLRCPLLRYDAVNDDFDLRLGSADAAGQGAFLLTSLTPPVCGVGLVNPFRGWQNDFSIDVFSPGFAGVGGASATCDGQGDAIFAFPNLAVLSGLSIYHCALQVDLSTFEVIGLTDTVTVQP